MHRSSGRVAVTGIGPLCSLGTGKAQVWDSILKGRTNIVRQSYQVAGSSWGDFPLHRIPDFNINNFDLPPKNLEFIKELRTIKQEDTDLYYFLAVVQLALKDSGLKYDVDDNDIGLIISHEMPGLETFFEELADNVYQILSRQSKLTRLELAKEMYSKDCEDRGYNLQSFSYLFAVAKMFNIHGSSLFVNNACASGIFAIETGARQIKSGTSPAVIVAAVDNPAKIFKYLWFKKHGLYAEDGIMLPFSSDAHGVVFGEGGAALVLEDMKHAIDRGAEIYAEYCGGGVSLEGWKITVPDVTNDFYSRSFRKALKCADMQAEEIDFVNPHGVSMKITDTYEATTINNIFLNKKPLVSAFKPIVGHNLGGSAMLETALSVLSLKNNFIPAAPNSVNINAALKLNIVTENLNTKIRAIAKMACGFAGFNGVCIFKKSEI